MTKSLSYCFWNKRQTLLLPSHNSFSSPAKCTTNHKFSCATEATCAFATSYICNYTSLLILGSCWRTNPHFSLRIDNFQSFLDSWSRCSWGIGTSTTTARNCTTLQGHAVMWKFLTWWKWCACVGIKFFHSGTSSAMVHNLRTKLQVIFNVKRFG